MSSFYLTITCLWSAATLLWIVAPAPCEDEDEPHRCGVSMGCSHATESGAQFHWLTRDVG